MGKCVFKEYKIQLRGKTYYVLVPGVEITEMWVMLWGSQYKNPGWDFLVADRTALKWIRNAYIALTQNPNRIIYFPIGNVEQMSKELKYTQQPPELIMYTHQRQLKRREWCKIKQCMKYTKSKQMVVRYNLSQLSSNCKDMLHQWKKQKSYYRYKQRKWRDDEKMFYQYETCFLETSRKQALYTAVEIQNALERNLEAELYEREYLQYTAGSRCGSGLSYEFGTKEFLRKM